MPKIFLACRPRAAGPGESVHFSGPERHASPLFVDLPGCRLGARARCSRPKSNPSLENPVGDDRRDRRGDRSSRGSGDGGLAADGVGPIESTRRAGSSDPASTAAFFKERPFVHRAGFYPRGRDRAPSRAAVLSRAAYVSALLVLMCTAWLLLAGTQVVRNLGDMARFGAMLFQILAPLQLALAIFFSALLAASGVAQEKDRRTLVLLLLTNLTNSELVLGKLLASMLNVLVLLAASLPLFMLSALFGGVSFEQIARVFAVTLATAWRPAASARSWRCGAKRRFRRWR